jgi:hypothetical protein
MGPSRRHPTTVSGFMIARTLDRLDQRCRKASPKESVPAGQDRARPHGEPYVMAVS